MLEQQLETLKKTQATLSVLLTLDDAFQNALNSMVLDKHNVGRINAIHVSVSTILDELRMQEKNLLTSIDHLEKQK